MYSFPKSVSPLVTTFGIVLLAIFSGAVIAAVFTRYFSTCFGFGCTILLADLQHYAFAALVLVGILSAFVSDAHVSARFFTSNHGVKAKGRNLENSLGFRLMALLCTFVPFGLIAIVSLSDVVASWAIFESSSQPGGLPGYFLVKSMVPVFCITLVYFGLRKIIATTRSGN